jgi:hypothetical protein
MTLNAYALKGSQKGIPLRDRRIMRFRFTYILLSVFIFSCNEKVNDGFNSIEIRSSKNKRIYLNSINWGITGDHQISIITNYKDRLKYNFDTTGTINGLMCIIYKFKNDTLFLYHLDTIKHLIPDSLNGIFIKDHVISNSIFSNLAFQAMQNNVYHFIPNTPTTRSNMHVPKPPKP